MRDKIAIMFKVVFMSLLGMIFGLVYFQLGTDQTSIQDRTGLLFFLTMNQAFGSTIGPAQAIPRQIAVVQRERANRMYAIFPYYLSNLVVTVPIEIGPVLANALVVYYMADLHGSVFVFCAILILETTAAVSLGMCLSSCFKSVTMAPQIAPAVVIVFLVFNGFMINEASIPAYFIWLREISFIRYAFKALMVNEFEGAAFTCGDAFTDTSCASSGNAVLSQLGFLEDGTIVTCVVILLGISAAFNLLAFLILLYRKPTFLALRAEGIVEETKAVDSKPAPIEDVKAEPNASPEESSV